MKIRSAVTTLLAVCMLVSLFCACTVIRKEPITPGIENVTIVSNCLSIGRDEEVEPNTKTVLQTELARNEGEAVQFICNFDTDVKNLAVTVSELSDSNGNTLDVTPYREHYIYIGENPSYVRKGWIPDALIPIEYADTNSVDVKAGQNQGFWLTANSTLDQPAGIYTGEVTLTYDGGIKKIPVEIEVWDFAVPVEFSFETDYGVYGSDAWRLMSKNNATDGWTDQKVFEQYYEFFLDYRICGRTPPFIGGNYANYVKKLIEEDPRINSITLRWGEWTFHDEDGNVFVPDYVRTEIEQLRANGVLDKCHLYIFDEIGDGTALQRAVLAAVKSLGSDVKVMTTSSPREALADSVQVFCGIWSAETVSYERYIREWQERGYDVWWYGCIAPQAPYPTYHTQDRLMSSRVVHWMQKDWNITGNLYWVATYSVVNWDFERGTYSGSRNPWAVPYATPCAGDGYLVYPGTKNDGIVNRNIPVPTLRLESVRDGSEDNEYLCILTDKIQQKLDAWGITDIDADAIMDTYYTPVYNTMGDYNHDPEIMLEVRRQMAHDIMNADSIVSVLAYMDTENTNKREVRVYAEPNSEVTIDGNAATEVNHGAYSTYSAVFLTAYEDMRKILISVNGNEYERYLKTIEDYEFMELGCLSVKNSVQKLGLPFDYWDISDQYEENMFAPKSVKELGNLSDQLGSMSEERDSEKVIINTDKQINYAIRDCVRTDYNNTIPLVVTNEEISGDMQKLQSKRLTLYVPHGATIKVEGNDAERTAQSESYDTFTYDIPIIGASRYIYEVEVSDGGRTETFKKVVMQQIIKASQLVDLTDENTVSAIAAVSSNKYGTALDIKNGTLCASFPPLSRLTIPAKVFMTGTDLNGYTAIRFEVKNTGTETQSGIDVRVSAGSSNEECGQSGEIEPGQTVVVYAQFPEAYISNGSVKEVSNITFFSKDSSSTEQYEISNIAVLETNVNQN